MTEPPRPRSFRHLARQGQPVSPESGGPPRMPPPLAIGCGTGRPYIRGQTARRRELPAWRFDGRTTWRTPSAPPTDEPLAFRLRPTGFPGSRGIGVSEVAFGRLTRGR